jgi:hypothetical protein
MWRVASNKIENLINDSQQRRELTSRDDDSFEVRKTEIEGSRKIQRITNLHIFYMLIFVLYYVGIQVWAYISKFYLKDS